MYYIIVDRKNHQTIIPKLKADRENKDAKEIKRFYVKVPALVAHTNHPSGEVCGVGQAVDFSILEKNHELVAAGETHTVNNANKIQYMWCNSHKSTKQLKIHR